MALLVTFTKYFKKKQYQFYTSSWKVEHRILPKSLYKASITLTLESKQKKLQENYKPISNIK